MGQTLILGGFPTRLRPIEWGHGYTLAILYPNDLGNCYSVELFD